MVSLINFKIVQDELEFKQQENEQQADNKQQLVSMSNVQGSSNANHDDARLMLTKQDLSSWNNNNNATNNNNNNNECTSVQVRANPVIIVSSDNEKSAVVNRLNNNTFNQMQTTTAIMNHVDRDNRESNCINNKQPNEPHQIEQAETNQDDNFTVTWRKLRYVIEPKWHEKLMQQLTVRTRSNKKLNLQAQKLQLETTTSISKTNHHEKLSSQNEANSNNCQVKTDIEYEEEQIEEKNQNCCFDNELSSGSRAKIVLDDLDGSFKSGQLTAILGPSGKCLPCLI